MLAVRANAETGDLGDSESSRSDEEIVGDSSSTDSDDENGGGSLQSLWFLCTTFMLGSPVGLNLLLWVSFLFYELI